MEPIKEYDGEEDGDEIFAGLLEATVVECSRED